MWVVPAQVVARGIAMRSDSSAQQLHLCEQLFAGKSVEVFVHGTIFA